MDETATLMILGLVIGWIGHSVIASHIRRAHEEKAFREMVELSEKLGLYETTYETNQLIKHEPIEPGVTWLRPDKAHWSNN